MLGFNGEFYHKDYEQNDNLINIDSKNINKDIENKGCCDSEINEELEISNSKENMLESKKKKELIKKLSKKWLKRIDTNIKKDNYNKNHEFKKIA